MGPDWATVSFGTGESCDSAISFHEGPMPLPDLFQPFAIDKFGMRAAAAALQPGELFRLPSDFGEELQSDLCHI